MGTESPSPAAKPARARAVRPAIAAVDADATAATLTSASRAARDSDACMDKRVVIDVLVETRVSDQAVGAVAERADARFSDASVSGAIGHGIDGDAAAREDDVVVNASGNVPAERIAVGKNASDFAVLDRVASNASDDAPDANDAVQVEPDARDDADDAADQSDDASDLEAFIESDPALAPTAPSQLLVAPRVLDAEEVIALLQGLTVLLEGGCENGDGHEPHAAPTGCDRRDPKLPSLAWLFPYHAGAGRPARHKQGDHLRARRGVGKKARPAPRQAQGSLFGDRQRGEAP